MEDNEETLLEKEKERKSKVKADLPLNDNEYNNSYEIMDHAIALHIKKSHNCLSLPFGPFLV